MQNIFQLIFKTYFVFHMCWVWHNLNNLLNKIIPWEANAMTNKHQKYFIFHYTTTKVRLKCENNFAQIITAFRVGNKYKLNESIYYLALRSISINVTIQW